jgi:hypothetical protein
MIDAAVPTPNARELTEIPPELLRKDAPYRRPQEKRGGLVTCKSARILTCDQSPRGKREGHGLSLGPSCKK